MLDEDVVEADINGSICFLLMMKRLFVLATA
jgi:hypothetical protein